MLAHRLRRWLTLVKHWVDVSCLLGSAWITYLPPVIRHVSRSRCARPSRIRHVYVRYTSYVPDPNKSPVHAGRTFYGSDRQHDGASDRESPAAWFQGRFNVGPTSRRWPSIEPALGEHLTSNTHRDRDPGIQKQGRHITPGSNSNSLCSPHNYVNVVVHRPATRDLNQCWVDVGPASKTVGQHQPNVGSIYRVFWGEPNQVTIIPRKHRAGDIDSFVYMFSYSPGDAYSE